MIFLLFFLSLQFIWPRYTKCTGFTRLSFLPSYFLTQRARAACWTRLMRAVYCGGWLGRHRSRCLQPLQICLAFVHYTAINNTGAGGRETKVTHSAWQTDTHTCAHSQTSTHMHVCRNTYTETLVWHRCTCIPIWTPEVIESRFF